jgi:hypothetical protein
MLVRNKILHFVQQLSIYIKSLIIVEHVFLEEVKIMIENSKLKTYI